MRRWICLLTLAALAAAAAVPLGASAGGSPIDGTWKVTWTRAAQIGAGITPTSATYWAGPIVAVWRNGRFAGRNLRNGHTAHGTFAVRGDLVTIVLAPGAGVTAGVYVMRFSIFRDRLTWSTVPGRHSIDVFPTAPWTRVQ